MIVGNRNGCSGFTLIELLVTLAVAVILATVAVPGFQNLIATNRLASDYNEILAGLNYARSEAVKRREAIVAEIDVDGGTGKWVLRVHDGDAENPLRILEARDGRVVVNGFSVTFNSLGRRAACDDGAGGCEVSVGDSSISVGPAGRVGRGT